MSSTVFHENNNQMEENHEGKENEHLGEKENCFFYMKIPQNESYFSDHSGHEIIFDVTFAIAIPGVYASTKPRGSFATRTSIIDHVSRNVQLFYHLEFDLFSTNILKDSYKTDIGFYGVYAKIYPDKADSRIIPTWSDGQDTWVSWTQQYKIWMTDSHIKDLCSHKMKVKIWDSKDKCTPKVRFDRPKIPRSASRSKSANENINWTKQTVMNVSKEFSITSEYKEENSRVLPHEIPISQPIKINVDKNNQIIKSAQSTSGKKSNGTPPNIKVKEPEKFISLVESTKNRNFTSGTTLKLEKAKESQRTSELVQTKSQNLKSPNIKSSIIDTNLTKDNSLNPNIDSNFKLESRKSITLHVENEKEEKTEVSNIEINMAELFLKDYTLNRIKNSFANLEDMFCKVSIEPEIISLEQKKRLNPLVIKIQKINNFPIENEKVNEINKKYKPVYCEYQFSDFQRHQSLHRLHKKTIKFDDINILLLGEMSDIKIREQMLNSYFTVQIFHRTKQQSCQENNVKSEINPFDVTKLKSNIGDVSLTNSYKMVTILPTIKHQGEAKIDLSDIINKNLQFMEVTVSIVPASIIVTKEENEDRSSQVEEDQVNFIQAETSIKISFQLAAPLTVTLNPVDTNDYFTRLVLINNSISCDFIRETCANIILKYNCTELNFLGEDTSKMKEFLYSIKNTFTDINNVFVGFFLVDKEYELLFIESNHNNMLMLYNQLSISLQNFNNTMSLKLLYNDSLLFQDRLNFPILTMIPQVMSKDISFFASQPLLYVRDILPKTCSEGICRLKALVMTDSMQVVVRNDLIPTPQMIQDLSQYLCSHINSVFESNINNSLEADVKTKVSLPKLIGKKLKTVPEISNRKNMDQTNIIKTKPQQPMNYIYASKDCEFSYSSQNKNAISSAMKELRNQMNPNRRYTFSQDYLFSGTVDPVDLNDVYMDEENKLKYEYKWIHKGHTSAIKDVSEVNNLPSCRIEDIRDQWKENELHSSFMKPTIPERDSRKFPFDLYIRPINLIERSSIYVLSNDTILKEEESQKSKMQCNLLKNKTCAVDSRFKTHRILPQTELTERGRESSNQLSKLNGLRKDSLPVTNWVVKKYGDPNSISMLSVLPSEPAKSQCFTVGPDTNKNLVVNYILINKKDPNFKSVYNPNHNSSIYKNFNPKAPCKIQSPFSLTC